MSSGPAPDTVWVAVAAVAAVGIAVLVVGILVGVTAPGAAGPFAHGSGSGPSVAAEESVAHVDPSTVGGGSALGALERQVGSSLVEQVKQGAIDVGPEDYEQARDQLGDERYEDLLEEYKEITGETGSDERYETLFRARRAQSNLTEHVAAYWERYGQYASMTRTSETDGSALGPSFGRVEWVDGGPTVLTAREHARRLELRTARINESVAAAVDAYGSLAESRDEDFTEVVGSIRENREAVLRMQREVRSEQFVPTTLTVTADGDRISPARPLAIHGRLETAEGETLDPDVVTFDVGEQNHTTALSDEGEFSFEYRPTLLPANASEVTIRYRPANDSAYLGEERTVDVAVERARPDVTVSTNVTTAHFNRTIGISGAVQSDGAGHADVPYVLGVGGRPLVDNTTGPDGRIERTVRLPPSIPPGEHEVVVRLPLENRTLVGTAGSTDVDVRETESELALEATHLEDRTVAVDGTLHGVEGGAVPNRSIRFDVAGETVATTTTDENGSFSHYLAVPPSADEAGESLAVTATFDGTGTNLGSATERTDVTLPAGSALAVPSWLVAVVGAVVALLGGGYLLYQLRPGRGSRRRDPPAAQADPLAPTRGESAVAGSLLDRATELLAEDRPAAAVQAGYVALRYRLAGDSETTRSQTHWEFYRTYGDRLDDEAAAALRRVTEGYERAAYAGDSVDEATADDVVEAVRGLAEPRGDAAAD